MKTFSGRRASQNEAELNSFIGYLQRANVKSYLEIGARHGDTFHEVMSRLPVGSYGLAVDMPGYLWGNFKSRESLRAAVKDLRDKGYDCHYLFADSQQLDTVEKIREIAASLPGGTGFDALLIDGDHTLAGVTADWKNYGGLAPIVAFHDIVGTGQYEKVHHNPVEVPILWETIKRNHKTLEFVDKDSKMGIGVCSR
ncbi:hypothetical protein GCM10027347_58980 [Larkinella harenae]